MKVTLQSTTMIVDFKGIPCRIWEGASENGVPCIALICQIAHHKDHDARAQEFQRDLQENVPPVMAIDPRFII